MQPSICLVFRQISVRMSTVITLGTEHGAVDSEMLPFSISERRINVRICSKYNNQTGGENGPAANRRSSFVCMHKKIFSHFTQKQKNRRHKKLQLMGIHRCAIDASLPLQMPSFFFFLFFGHASANACASHRNKRHVIQSARQSDSRTDSGKRDRQLRLREKAENLLAWGPYSGPTDNILFRQVERQTANQA